MLRERSPDSPALERDDGRSYTRKEVCRLLKIDNRQLKTWERQRLIPELNHYRFSELLLLKTVATLRAADAHPRLLKQALDSARLWLKKAPNLSDGDFRVYKEGKRVRIQIGKQKMEPASGQLLFDFSESELQKLLQLPPSQKSGSAIADKVKNKLEADHWFERGLELEKTGAKLEQVIEAYQKAAQLDPNSAAALVNLGTVFFNGHAWSDAEAQYRKALAIEPNYALAHFNLGNLYDERGDGQNALVHYQEAIRIHPSYADAHYNLALLYQGLRDPLGAMRHWRAYLRLDANSTWAQIARRELDKLEAATIVRGSRPPTSKLHLVKSDIN